METTCGSLATELQGIWSECGVSHEERTALLVSIQEECLSIYKTKIREAENQRIAMNSQVSSHFNEIHEIFASLGDRLRMEAPIGSLREQIDRLSPVLTELRKRRKEQEGVFTEVQHRLFVLTSELTGVQETKNIWSPAEEQDLTSGHLQALKKRIRVLEEEKGSRLAQLMAHVQEVDEMCQLMDIPFKDVLKEVHVSLGEVDGGEHSGGEQKSVSMQTLNQLKQRAQELEEEKIRRTNKLLNLRVTMRDLCRLLDIQVQDRHQLQALDDESANHPLKPGALSAAKIDAISTEVQRLETEKVLMIKDIVLKKCLKLEDICFSTHLFPPEDWDKGRIEHLLHAGLVDPCELLAKVESDMVRVTEEKLSRREILEDTQKWHKAVAEELWLAEYEKTENRYQGKGQHLNMQRAEGARKMVAKIPDLVSSLRAKVDRYEQERQQEFMYDGVRLISIIAEDHTEREKRELEKRRHLEWAKEEKKRQTEEEVLYGALPRSAAKGSVSASARKQNPCRTPAPFASPDRRHHHLGSTPSQAATPRGKSHASAAYGSSVKQSSSKPLRCTPVVMGKDSGKNNGMGSTPSLRTLLVVRQEVDDSGDGTDSTLETSIRPDQGIPPRSLQF